MSEPTIINSDTRNETPTLTVGIPAGRSIEWASRIVTGLDGLKSEVQVLIARWVENPISEQKLDELNMFVPTKQVLSEARHSPAMRNTIIREANSTHILFLDDDMIPGQNLLTDALKAVGREPYSVHQGIPYHVANPDNWLARMEGRLYERGYKKYINEDDTVSLLDARLLLAPVKTMAETPFDESLDFGSGEGSELARSLLEKGIMLRLARELNAKHTNRDSVISLAQQKLIHGRGRGYELRQHGPGENGWSGYFRYYANRHYVQPAIELVKNEIGVQELFYVWGTNTVMWAGVFDYMLGQALRS